MLAAAPTRHRRDRHGARIAARASGIRLGRRRHALRASTAPTFGLLTRALADAAAPPRRPPSRRRARRPPACWHRRRDRACDRRDRRRSRTPFAESQSPPTTRTDAASARNLDDDATPSAASAPPSTRERRGRLAASRRRCRAPPVRSSARDRRPEPGGRREAALTEEDARLAADQFRPIAASPFSGLFTILKNKNARIGVRRPPPTARRCHRRPGDRRAEGGGRVCERAGADDSAGVTNAETVASACGSRAAERRFTVPPSAPPSHASRTIAQTRSTPPASNSSTCAIGARWSSERKRLAAPPGTPSHRATAARPPTSTSCNAPRRPPSPPRQHDAPFAWLLLGTAGSARTSPSTDVHARPSLAAAFAARRAASSPFSWRRPPLAARRPTRARASAARASRSRRGRSSTKTAAPADAPATPPRARALRRRSAGARGGAMASAAPVARRLRAGTSRPRAPRRAGRSVRERSLAGTAPPRDAHGRRPPSATRPGASRAASVRRAAPPCPRRASRSGDAAACRRRGGSRARARRVATPRGAARPARDRLGVAPRPGGASAVLAGDDRGSRRAPAEGAQLAEWRRAPVTAALPIARRRGPRHLEATPWWAADALPRAVLGTRVRVHGRCPCTARNARLGGAPRVLGSPRRRAAAVGGGARTPSFEERRGKGVLPRPRRRCPPRPVVCAVVDRGPATSCRRDRRRVAAVGAALPLAIQRVPSRRCAANPPVMRTPDGAITEAPSWRLNRPNAPSSHRSRTVGPARASSMASFARWTATVTRNPPGARVARRTRPGRRRERLATGLLFLGRGRRRLRSALHPRSSETRARPALGLGMALLGRPVSCSPHRRPRLRRPSALSTLGALVGRSAAWGAAPGGGGPSRSSSPRNSAWALSARVAACSLPPDQIQPRIGRSRALVRGTPAAWPCAARRVAHADATRWKPSEVASPAQ